MRKNPYIAKGTEIVVGDWLRLIGCAESDVIDRDYFTQNMTDFLDFKPRRVTGVLCTGNRKEVILKLQGIRGVGTYRIADLAFALTYQAFANYYNQFVGRDKSGIVTGFEERPILSNTIWDGGSDGDDITNEVIPSDIDWKGTLCIPEPDASGMDDYTKVCTIKKLNGKCGDWLECCNCPLFSMCSSDDATRNDNTYNSTVKWLYNFNIKHGMKRNLIQEKSMFVNENLSWYFSVVNKKIYFNFVQQVGLVPLTTTIRDLGEDEGMFKFNMLKGAIESTNMDVIDYFMGHEALLLSAFIHEIMKLQRYKPYPNADALLDRYKGLVIHSCQPDCDYKLVGRMFDDNRRVLIEEENMVYSVSLWNIFDHFTLNNFDTVLGVTK